MQLIANRIPICLAVLWISAAGADCVADGRMEHFEAKVRPVLIKYCYECHSADAKELKGELRLDRRAGWQLGGESGEPAIVPGMPDASPLIRTIRHEDGVAAMPPNQPKLPADVITDLTIWVQMGAVDPREGEVERPDRQSIWEAEYQRRLDWWSLQPIRMPAVPDVKGREWPVNDVDRFVLAKLETSGLRPTTEAERHALARRLSFALTGLPPDPLLSERFVASESSSAFEELVATLLDSPHFGERWARHWMDVVHYSDTHGYEWDVPVKNAWRYRDYLIRAFNADVPYRQLILEQIAGDLVEPRVDPTSGLIDSLIGPLALRLGERRHGDNSAAEGVTQEAVANMIDTMGKALLGTTLACAQCHDHKLDAVEQRDYYSLAGMLMSTRFSSRTVDASDPNVGLIVELSELKRQLREELSRVWLAAIDSETAGGVMASLKAISLDEKPATTVPATIVEFWKRSLNSPLTAEEFAQERDQRVAANRQNLTLLADFASCESLNGWRWDGWGMQHGLTRNGEIVVTDEGQDAVLHLLPAGRFSHVWSQRLAGSLQSPQLDPLNPITLSLEAISGKFSSQSFVVDRALNPERLQFPNTATLSWRTLTAGNFDSLEGSIDKLPRRVYLELATKSLNNYFPPRIGYGGVSEAETVDQRSWFGVTRIVQHPAGQAPQDELTRFQPLFEAFRDESDWSKRLSLLLRAAVERWKSGDCDSEDVRLLNDALLAKLLPNSNTVNAEVSRIVSEYRAVEKKMEPDRTVGSVADWNEGRDEPIGIRGSYTEFGSAIHRGAIRLLSHGDSHVVSDSSGRLEWAQRIVDRQNPLTARVYVNRVWHYLFGEGLVRTPDDFGHLGEPPTHPELLDYLAARFMDEGWSTKKLIRLLVTSATWRQKSLPDAAAIALDPENRMWHHMPMRRLEAEALRDSILVASGRWDRSLFGPPIEPYRTAEDAQKRLLKGPLDGNGRRSLYLEMTLMEPPRFLALFNQPLPKQTVGRRDVTNVPDQALALLNDPFVVSMSREWSQQLLVDGATSAEMRIERMVERALSRPARGEELDRMLQLVRRSAELRAVSGDNLDILACQPAWQDAAHAIFNLKEFLYVP